MWEKSNNQFNFHFHSVQNYRKIRKHDKNAENKQLKQEIPFQLAPHDWIIKYKTLSDDCILVD